MRKTRVIPTLLLKNQGFYKTTKFKNPVYLGDPINILKIFNEKEVDEICVLDISATPTGAGPQLDYIGDFASECFVPLSYGGGISKIQEISRIFRIGFEKCIINSSFFENEQLIKDASTEYGSQSIVVSIDVKRKLFGGYNSISFCGNKKINLSPKDAACRAEELGAGEILLTSIDCEGSMAGYDLNIVKEICSIVSIPVIVNGGAGNINHFKYAVDAGASAVAAGAFFVFTGPHKAVLINVPNNLELDRTLK